MTPSRSDRRTSRLLLHLNVDSMLNETAIHENPEEVASHVIAPDGTAWCPRDGGWHPTVSHIFEDELTEMCSECGRQV